MNVRKRHQRLERHRVRRKSKAKVERIVRVLMGFQQRAFRRNSDKSNPFWAAPDGSMRWIGDY